MDRRGEMGSGGSGDGGLPSARKRNGKDSQKESCKESPPRLGDTPPHGNISSAARGWGAPRSE